MKRAGDNGIVKWKEAKEITGVSASSIVDLKAVIASERSNQGSAKVRRIATERGNDDVDVTKLKNKGVGDRAQRDADANEREAALHTWQHGLEILKEKSRIYDQFVKGGSLEPGAIDKDYLIDFEKKSWDQNEDDSREKERSLFHSDIQREEQRQRWEDDARKQKEEDDAAFEKRKEDRSILNEVMLETIKGRERAQQLQQERKMKLEIRKLEVQKKVEEQKSRQEAMKRELEAKEKEAEAEKERKKLHIKPH